MLRQLRQILEKEQIRFVLAGGLTPDNVSRGIDIFHRISWMSVRVWKKNLDREPEKTGKNTEICAEHAFYCLDGGKSEI